MCSLLWFLSLGFFFAAYITNYLAVRAYRDKLADCLMKKEGFPKNFFIIHPLGILLSSFALGLLAVFALWELMLSFSPFKLLYFLSTAVVSVFLHNRFRGYLLEYTRKEFADYLSLSYIPLAVSVFGAIIYATYLYNTATFADFIPNPDPFAYLKEIQNTYGGCPILGTLIVLIKIWDYLLKSLELNLLRIGREPFLLAVVLTFIKEGISIWVLNRTVLGLKIMIERPKT